ncbi:MAG: SMP-30/gluconolactonase/LRE family protein [Alphaproteobacteria bacterium]|nr:SMP-30/gluconolactonase/LRE family protein [Alphaproteobacteria bacterium]
MWTPSERYPDPSVRVLDPRGAGLIPMNASVERLYTGTRWSEGPVWFGDGHFLVWSDIPNNRMLRWTEETGAVSEFRKPSNFSNGNTRDRQGRLVSCEHFTRRVTRTEYDGTITVLADKFEGKRLNSPNDVVVKSDGSVWFSDPAFGILSDYEGERAPSELPMAFYRLDPATGKLTVVADGMDGPNGLCFSPDEKLLYVVESASRPRRTWVFDVVGDKLANKRPFADCGELGTPDGWRCDERGNVWAGWGMGEGLDGVRVFAPDGTPILHIDLPERCANLCFGGKYHTRLFMAASHSLYSIYTSVRGVTTA